MQVAKRRFEASQPDIRIQELADARFSLIPLGGGNDGKSPSVVDLVYAVRTAHTPNDLIGGGHMAASLTSTNVRVGSSLTAG